MAAKPDWPAMYNALSAALFYRDNAMSLRSMYIVYVLGERQSHEGARDDDRQANGLIGPKGHKGLQSVPALQRAPSRSHWRADSCTSRTDLW